MKKTNAKIFASLLRRIARELEVLSDSELQSLEESPTPLLTHVIRGDTKKSGAAEMAVKEFDIAHTIEQLRVLSSREEGVSLLKKVASTKVALTILARALDLPVGKKTPIEELVEKVVESTIGFRIRSAAIRGANTENAQDLSAQKSESGEQVIDEVEDNLKPSVPKKG